MASCEHGKVEVKKFFGPEAKGQVAHMNTEGQHRGAVNAAKAAAAKAAEKHAHGHKHEHGHGEHQHGDHEHGEHCAEDCGHDHHGHDHKVYFRLSVFAEREKGRSQNESRHAFILSLKSGVGRGLGLRMGADLALGHCT